MNGLLNRRLLLTALLPAALCLPVSAADWPNRPLHLIVGFPAGSSPDLTARALAEPLSRALGQPVVVDNKVGAGGNIAADAVAKATDGHTLGLMINGNMTIAGLLNPKLPYDPLKDLAPVSLIGTAPLLLTAPAGSPRASRFRRTRAGARTPTTTRTPRSHRAPRAPRPQSAQRPHWHLVRVLRIEHVTGLKDLAIDGHDLIPCKSKVGVFSPQ